MIPEQVVVITGPIGSGKSYIADAFRQRGWSSLDADVIGHEILHDPSVLAEVEHKWPKVIHRGAVDRKALAAVVFADPQALAALDAMTHPLIIKRITAWLAETTGRRAVEVPLPKVIAPSWGIVVVVDAPAQERLDRLVGRGMRMSDAARRMASQPGRAAWLDIAEIVLDNRAQGNGASVRLLDYFDSR